MSNEQQDASAAVSADAAIDAFIAARTVELVDAGVDSRVAATLACHELFEHEGSADHVR